MRNLEPVKNALDIVQLLKDCASHKDLSKGTKLHAYIQDHTYLAENSYVANSLVNMYAKCGALGKAQQVLKQLSGQHVVAWSAVIAGYAEKGQGEEALKCFDCMQHEGLSPDAVTFICALKACGITGAAAKGKQIHHKLVNLGMLENDIVLGSALLDMYAKCGSLGKAQQVMEELPVRNVVTWNALIGGYVQHGQGDEALKCFDSMQYEGHSPNAVTFICALKACGSTGAADKGEEIHGKIVNLGMLEQNIVLGNTLVDMYARCGELIKAEKVFKGLPLRNVVTWNALMTGYIQQRQAEEALRCYDRMQCAGHSPDAVTFTCALNACGSIRAAAKGEQIHDKIVSLGMLEKSIVLGNILVDMYAKCGALAKAWQVLEGLPVRDVVTWNALIAGYAEQGEGEEALKFFDNMQSEGLSPDAVTLTCALKACGSKGALTEGEQIHDQIVKLGMLEKDVLLGNSLVDIYVRCGALATAQKVLERLSVRNSGTWNALIAGYTQQGQGEEALKCYDNMQSEGHVPDAVTFICALKACGTVGAAAEGQQIHNKIVSLHMLEKNIELGNSLVGMYARCGLLSKAQEVLEGLLVRNVVTWNALIAGYVQQGQQEEALKCFEAMQCQGHSPDTFTFTCALKACESRGAASKGEQIRHKIVSLGLDKDVVLATTLVDTYIRCGALAKAHEVHEGLHIRNVATWTALIAGYAEKGQGEEALRFYDSMQYEGNLPDAGAFISALKACATIGTAAKGEQIYDKIISLGMLEKNVMVGNSLVGMYARCGAFAKAAEVFKELPVQNVVTWNALMGGYAIQGKSSQTFNYFEKMQQYGVKPDTITLTCVLNACSHSGLLDEAEMFFSETSRKYGITPDAEHYCCMVDLFGRARVFCKILMLFENLPCAESLPVWIALLGACRKWGEVKIGRLAFNHALELEINDAAVYVCMADIYIADGMQEDADKIRALRLTRKV